MDGFDGERRRNQIGGFFVLMLFFHFVIRSNRNESNTMAEPENGIGCTKVLPLISFRLFMSAVKFRRLASFSLGEMRKLFSPRAKRRQINYF